MKLLWLSLVLVASYLPLERCVQAQTTQAPETTIPAKANATYWITTSNKLRPGRPFQLTIRTTPDNAPVSLTVTITFQTYDVNSTVRTLLTWGPRQVLAGVVQTLLIDIPYSIKVKSTEYGWYKINIEGQGSTLNFQHSESLNLLEQVVSIFIATDKAMYKPGQTVNFRALVVDPVTLNVLQEPMDIYVKDPKGNIIKQMLRVTGPDTLGVVEDSLQLAASTPLGDWEISAVYMGQTETKTITVSNYVLPKFEVEVKTPSIPLTTARAQTITVSAKYTFGQPVTDCSATVRVTLNQPWLPSKTENEIVRKGKCDSNGKFEVDINNKQLLNLVVNAYSYTTDLIGWTFLVEGNITEGPTKKVQSSSATMQMYNSPMQATFLPISPTNFQPGLAYTGYVQVNQVDGTKCPAEVTSKIKAHFFVTYEVAKPPEATTTAQPNSSSDDSAGKIAGGPMFWHPYQQTETKNLTIDNAEQSIPESGFLVITFNLPPEAISASIQVTFDKPFENINAYQYISKVATYSNAYLQIESQIKQPKVGETMMVKVVSTELVKMLIWQVYSKGILVANNTVNSPTSQGSKSISFYVIISQNMVPTITIVVFSFTETNGEVFAAAQSIGIDGMFLKPVTMSFSEDRVEPGTDLYAIVKGEPGSIVYMVGRDESSELLKNGSDLTDDLVRNNIASFQSGYFSPQYGYMFMCGWPWIFGGPDMAGVFQSADVLFFSNALVYRTPYNIYPMMANAEKGGDANSGAASRPTSSGLLEANKVRNNFIETFIWNISRIPSNSNGELKLKVKVPDTITKWLGRVFSVHPTFGLSVGSTTATVTTFRNLFVSLDLPVFFIQNEIFCFACSVMSYNPETIPVLLRFESGEGFYGAFVNRSGDGVIMSSENKAAIDYYPEVAQNEVKTTWFCINPTKIGEITLKVSALTNVPGLSDAVEQVVTVRPEGVTLSNNFPYMPNLTTGYWQKEVTVVIPDNAVSDSQSIQVSVVANFMGSFLKNIKDLLQMPYGCGEQNMINFAPSVTLLEYFYATKTLTPETLEMAKSYISVGYQTELTFEHTDAGYSAFNNNGDNSSTWLAAFVVSTYSRAVIVDVTNKVGLGLDMTQAIYRTSLFLISNQNDDGSFTEKGVVFHVAMQGGSSGGVALTAYTLISLASANEALKDNLTATPEIQKSMNRAGDYLESTLNNLVDSYVICIVTYALNKINHRSKDIAFAKMEQKAIIGDGVKYWTQDPPAQPLDIESTSYGMLTYTLRGVDIAEQTLSLRYLAQKLGPNGGFTSTQDTVIGLEAVSAVMAKLYSGGTYSMTVTISYNNESKQPQEKLFKISKETELLLQTVDIPCKKNCPASLIFTATTDNGGVGPSTVLIDTVVSYNVKRETSADCLEMSHSISYIDRGLELTITLKSKEALSMTLLMVQIPAGSEPSVLDSDNIERVDPYEGDTLNIYFNSYVINNEGISVTIVMQDDGGTLVDPKDRSYTAFDYYNPKKCSRTQSYIIGSQPICNTIPDVGICQHVTQW